MTELTLPAAAWPSNAGPEVLALESVDLPEGWQLDEARIDAAAGVTQKDGAVTGTLVGMHRQPAARDWPFVPDPQGDAAGYSLKK